jgi:hypothetical protein
MEWSKKKLASCLKQKFILPVTSAHLSNKMKRIKWCPWPCLTFTTITMDTEMRLACRLSIYFSFISILINIKKYIQNICKKETTQPLIPIFEKAIIISCLLGWVTWLTLLQ